MDVAGLIFFSLVFAGGAFLFWYYKRLAKRYGKHEPRKEDPRDGTPYSPVGENPEGSDGGWFDGGGDFGGGGSP